MTIEDRVRTLETKVSKLFVWFSGLNNRVDLQEIKVDEHHDFIEVLKWREAAQHLKATAEAVAEGMVSPAGEEGAGAMAIIEESLGVHEGGLELIVAFDEDTDDVHGLYYNNPSNIRAKIDFFEPETGVLLDTVYLPGNLPERAVAQMSNRIQPQRGSMNLSFGYAPHVQGGGKR